MAGWMRQANGSAWFEMMVMLFLVFVLIISVTLLVGAYRDHQERITVERDCNALLEQVFVFLRDYERAQDIEAFGRRRIGRCEVSLSMAGDVDGVVEVWVRPEKKVPAYRLLYPINEVE